MLTWNIRFLLERTFSRDLSSMADHNNLIDDNGNPLAATVVTAGMSSTSSFLSNIWKRMWPSREARIKYQVHTTTLSTNLENSPEMVVRNKMCEGVSGTSSFWSRMSTSLALTSNHRGGGGGGGRGERCDNDSSMNTTNKVELALEDRQNGNCSDDSNSNSSNDSSSTTTTIITTAYDQVPRMKTNRKVYGETTTPINKTVRTRRESILSNNRKMSRNLNDYSHLSSPDKRLDAIIEHQVIDDTRDSGSFGGGGGFRKFKDCDNNMAVQVKRVSFKDEQNDSNMDEEDEDDQWLVQQRSVGRENFYNVNEVDMASLYRTGKQSDVTIRCRGKEFRVHSFVLKAQSGHFRRLLFIKNESSPIVINDMTCDDMEALLKYMYTGEIDDNYTSYEGFISSRFSFLLQDYDVPLPHECADVHTAIL